MKMSVTAGFLLALAGAVLPSPAAPAGKAPYQKDFDVRVGDLSSTGRNPYFVLEPGYVLTYQGTEDGQPAELVVTVLPETRVLAGIETRVVEERETSKGQISEVSRNFFAISKSTGDVYYFGEEVDNYKDGRLHGHEGSWLAGEHGYRFGLALPAQPKQGQRYFQEIAPGTAMDRAEILSLEDTLSTPAGRFEHVLKTRESSPLEPGVKEYKYYAPGVGLIRDGGLLLQKIDENGSH
jgi:hypothetical protein